MQSPRVRTGSAWSGRRKHRASVEEGVGRVAGRRQGWMAQRAGPSRPGSQGKWFRLRQWGMGRKVTEGHRTGSAAPSQGSQTGSVFLKSRHPAFSYLVAGSTLRFPSFPVIHVCAPGPGGLSQGWLPVPPVGAVLPSLYASGLFGAWQKVDVKLMATTGLNIKDPSMNLAHLLTIQWPQ